MIQAFTAMSAAVFVPPPSSPTSFYAGRPACDSPEPTFLKETVTGSPWHSSAEPATPSSPSRAARKFRRNRMAVASLAVILLYALARGWLLIAGRIRDAHGPARVRSCRVGHRVALHRPHARQSRRRVGRTPRPRVARNPLAEDRARSSSITSGVRGVQLRLKDSRDRVAAVRTCVFGSAGSMTPEESPAQGWAIRDQYNESLNAVDDLDAHDARGAPNDPVGIESDIDRSAPSLRRGKGLCRPADEPRTDRQGAPSQPASIRSRWAFAGGDSLSGSFPCSSALLGASGYFGGFLDRSSSGGSSQRSQACPTLCCSRGAGLRVHGQHLRRSVALPSRSSPWYIAMCMTFWIGPCRVIRGDAQTQELGTCRPRRPSGSPASRSCSATCCPTRCT